MGRLWIRLILGISVGIWIVGVLLVLIFNMLGQILPTGDHLAYMAYVNGYWQIMLMDTGRGLSDQLTSGQSNNRYPAWSPDGQSIAFHSDRDGNHYELYVMNVDGRELRRLTAENMFEFAADDQPAYMLGNAMAAWSPDGQQIAFHSDVGGDWDLFLMSPDGQEIERLTSRLGDEVLFSWSPDGERGLFSMSDPELPNIMHIYTMDMETREVEQLTFDDTLTEFLENPVSGQFVPLPEITAEPGAVATIRPEIAATVAALNNPNLSRIPPPGSGNSGALPNTSVVPPGQITIMQDWHPEWSPDGQKIVFAAERDTYSDNIFVYDVEEELVTQLTEGLFTDHNPVWSPDGRYIVFASDRDGVQQIFVMNNDGSDMYRLTDLRYESNGPAWRP